MVRALRPLRSEAFTQQQQAAFFHSRERRKSRGELLELFRTHQLRGAAVIALATFDPATLFPSNELDPITIQTSIRFADNATARSGLIFELSDATGGAALWLTDTTMVLRAGSVIAAEIATATFDNVSQWPATLELDITCVIIPGSGVATILLNNYGSARAVASGGDLGTVGWLAGNNGSFASVVNGANPTLPVTTAPAEFDVIAPLDFFVNQRPRQVR